MKTLKHSFQRRNHKERAQPVERERWGLLEKPKDYRLRAQDYQSKQRRLKRLREKAAEKNPDEFYFGMMREKTRDGIVSVDRGHPVLSEETVRLLKTQDAAYIKTMLRIEEKKVSKLEKDIYGSFQAASYNDRKHHHFVDETELEQYKNIKNQKKHMDVVNSVHEIDTEKHLINENFVKTESDQTHGPLSIEQHDKTMRHKQMQELKSRKARISQLSLLARQLEVERHLQTKGERRKIGTSHDGIPIYKWKLERKR